MQYEIETGIDMPRPRSNKCGNNSWIDGMEVNSSIVVDLPTKELRNKEISRIRGLMRTRKMKSAQRAISDTTIRIWRIA